MHGGHGPHRSDVCQSAVVAPVAAGSLVNVVPADLCWSPRGRVGKDNVRDWFVSSAASIFQQAVEVAGGMPVL